MLSSTPPKQIFDRVERPVPQELKQSIDFVPNQYRATADIRVKPPQWESSPTKPGRYSNLYSRPFDDYGHREPEPKLVHSQFIPEKLPTPRYEEPEHHHDDHHEEEVDRHPDSYDLNDEGLLDLIIGEHMRPKEPKEKLKSGAPRNLSDHQPERLRNGQQRPIQEKEAPRQEEEDEGFFGFCLSRGK